MGRRKRVSPTPAKARQILREGQIGGRPLTSAQRRYFGLIAGGGTPTRLRRKRRKR